MKTYTINLGTIEYNGEGDLYLEGTAITADKVPANLKNKCIF